MKEAEEVRAWRKTDSGKEREREVREREEETRKNSEDNEETREEARRTLALCLLVH